MTGKTRVSKLWDVQDFWWMAFCLALGLFLRLYHLGQYSLWYDEVEQMATARAPWADFFAMAKGRHQAPPLDFILMRPFVLFATSDAAARVWSVVASTLCIPVIYAWCRSVAGKDAAKLGAIFMAASPFAVAYAQEARMYSSFLLFTLLSFWALQRLHEAPSKWGASDFRVGRFIGELPLAA